MTRRNSPGSAPGPIRRDNRLFPPSDTMAIVAHPVPRWYRSWQRLALGILQRAYLDLTTPMDAGRKSYGTAMPAHEDRDDALRWLWSRDFEWVCDAANVDVAVDALREMLADAMMEVEAGARLERRAFGGRKSG